MFIDLTLPIDEHIPVFPGDPPAEIKQISTIIEKGWNEKQLQKEIQNRIKILKWLKKKKLRSYSDVGTIVSKYHKDPKTILSMVAEDLK